MTTLVAGTHPASLYSTDCRYMWAGVQFIYKKETSPVENLMIYCFLQPPYNFQAAVGETRGMYINSIFTLHERLSLSFGPSTLFICHHAEFNKYQIYHIITKQKSKQNYSYSSGKQQPISLWNSQLREMWILHLCAVAL